MITVKVTGRHAVCQADDPITTGSIGMPVQFYLNAAWKELAPVAVFRADDVSVDIVLIGGSCTVPPEVLQTAGSQLWVGVYGRNAAGTIAIPTIWAAAGTIRPGTEPGGVDPAEPTPDWTAQVQQIAADAMLTAQAAEATAAEADERSQAAVTRADAAISQAAETLSAAQQAARDAAASADSADTSADFANASEQAAGRAATAAQSAATAAAASETNAAGSATAADQSAAGAAASAAEAQRILDSIPEDYTALAKEADDTKAVAQVYVTKVPPEYLRVEYLESTGEQAILIGGEVCRLSSGSRVVCDFAATSIDAATINNLFGSRHTTSEQYFAVNIKDGRWNIGWNTGATQETGADLKRHTIDFDRGQVYLDGDLIFTGAGSFDAHTVSPAIFAINSTAGQRVYYGQSRVYGFKIYQSTGPVTGLVFDGVPCIRVSDDTPGFYDSVQDRFIGQTLKAGATTGLVPGDVLTLENIERDIGVLQDQVYGINTGVKPYITAEADMVADKVRNLQTPNTLTMLCVSDMHYSAEDNSASEDKPAGAIIRAALDDMAAAVNAIKSQTKIDYLVSGGDVIWRMSADGDFDTGKAEMIACTKVLGRSYPQSQIRQIRLVGNHDVNCMGATGYFTHDQLYSFFSSYNNWTTDPVNKNHNYGYIDDEAHKVRLICLNTSEYLDAPTQNSTQMYVSPRQMRWLCDSLVLTGKADAEDWHIIIMSHVALDRHNTIRYMRIINAYIKGEKVPDFGVEQVAGYDFSGKNLASLDLMLHGHVHNYLTDTSYMRTATPTTIPLAVPRMAWPNALPGRDNPSEDDGPDSSGIVWSDVTIGKTPNMATSTAFVVDVVDLANQVIHSICYGAGYDRVLHYRAIEVSGPTTLTPSITATGWASKNAAIATVSNGVVTPVAAGYALVYAQDADGNREYYNVHVEV